MQANTKNIPATLQEWEERTSVKRRENAAKTRSLTEPKFLKRKKVNGKKQGNRKTFLCSLQ